MNIFSQLTLILSIWMVGEYISSFINQIIVIPGSIIGMIILFICLQFKIIKLDNIKEISNLLLDNMAIFFIPAGVSLINSMDLIRDNAMLLMTCIIVSTILVMYITAYVVQKMIILRNKEQDHV